MRAERSSIQRHIPCVHRPASVTGFPIHDVLGVVSSRREPLAPPAWAAHDANIPRFDDALVVMSHDDSVVESRLYATCVKYGH